MNNYDDIINLDRPVSKRPSSSMESRASQFAPFAALVGYDSEIKETARLTDKQIVLDDSQKEIISDKLNYLNEHLNDQNEITITYFIKDQKKSGGKYLQKTGIIKRIDLVKKNVKFTDNSIISMKDIINIKGNIFNDFPPVKIIIKNGEYFVYDLENNFRFETNDIDDLVKRLVPNDFNNVSRILKFQYLLNDINNKTITMSHPYIFEDKNECLYSLDKKVYMACFSKTIDKDNAYAWWKIYGITTDNSLDNIKVRIIFNKRDLLKNILLKKDKNFEYYFGDIKYIGDKKEKNDDIKDFFEKSTSFKFEREFRILIKYIGIDEIPNDKYNDKYKIFFKLDLDNKLYKSITLDNELYFDPYRNLEDKHKDAIKHILKEAQDKI